MRQNAFQSDRNGVLLRKWCLFSRWFQTSCGGTRETSLLIRVCEESGVSEEAGRVLSRHVRTLLYSRKLWFLQKRLKIPQPHLTRRWQTRFRTWKLMLFAEIVPKNRFRTEPESVIFGSLWSTFWVSELMRRSLENSTPGWKVRSSQDITVFFLTNVSSTQKVNNLIKVIPKWLIWDRFGNDS